MLLDSFQKPHLQSVPSAQVTEASAEVDVSEPPASVETVTHHTKSDVPEHTAALERQ